jgi:hypothetical protein
LSSSILIGWADCLPTESTERESVLATAGMRWRLPWPCSIDLFMACRPSGVERVRCVWGFAQDPGESPLLYPVACAPQARSAASVFLLFQACLGLEISGVDRQIYFTSPQLPASRLESCEFTIWRWPGPIKRQVSRTLPSGDSRVRYQRYRTAFLTGKMWLSASPIWG